MNNYVILPHNMDNFNNFYLWYIQLSIPHGNIERQTDDGVEDGHEDGDGSDIHGDILEQNILSNVLIIYPDVLSQERVCQPEIDEVIGRRRQLVDVSLVHVAILQLHMAEVEETDRKDSNKAANEQDG